MTKKLHIAVLSTLVVYVLFDLRRPELPSGVATTQGAEGAEEEEATRPTRP